MRTNEDWEETLGNWLQVGEEMRLRAASVEGTSELHSQDRCTRAQCTGRLGWDAKPASWRQKGLRFLNAQERDRGTRRRRDNGGTKDRGRGRKK